jgi:hypothetical protein
MGSRLRDLDSRVLGEPERLPRGFWKPVLALCALAGVVVLVAVAVAGMPFDDATYLGAFVAFLVGSAARVLRPARGGRPRTSPPPGPKGRAPRRE